MVEDTQGHEINELARRLQALLNDLAARHERLRQQRDARPYSTAELAAQATATFQWWKAEYGKIAAESAALGVSLADLLRVRA